MFSTVLQELKGYFGRDFLLGVFLPVLSFAGASLALFVEIRDGLFATLAAWEKVPLHTQAIAIISGLIVVATLSLIVHNLQFSRLFEGYWLSVPVLRWFRNPRVSAHRKRYDYLTNLTQSVGMVTLSNEIAAEQLMFYPPPNHLDKMMPTRFGNVVRGTQIYAYDRYGIESAIIWTRLRPLLSPEAATALENRKLMVDFSLTITLLSVSFSLIWCPILACYTNRWGLFLLCALGWPLAWACYHNAVQSAVAYCEQVSATFDLYRHNLLKALGRPLPKSIVEERKEWRRIAHFFYRNFPMPPRVVEAEQVDGWKQLGNLLSDYFEKVTSTKSSDNGEVRK
jgi:hypothetical protein